MKRAHSQEPGARGYEGSDAAAGPVFVAALVLALLIAGALAVSAWISQDLTDEIHGTESLSPVRALRKPPEGPELLAVPARELEQHRAWEERLLGATEWIDPVNRIVRIPIERALELSLAEGFPTRKPPEGAEQK